MPEDYILAIEFDPADEENVHARLFLTATTGWTSGTPASAPAEDAPSRRGEGAGRRVLSRRDGGVPLVVEAYFDSRQDRDEAARALADLNPRTIDRPRADWLAHYQQSLTALEIGRRFLVAPDASLLTDPNKLHLVVPQEQAFGTGSHETTALCIETLETLEMLGKRGLDVGSGSGIVAMAMLRLGASKAIAFDNDPDAYAALRDNRMRNGIDETAMPLFIGSVEALRNGTFDVVTMNIIPEVIVPLLPEVVRHVQGALILSGILVIKRDEVVAAAAQHGLELVNERSKGEWWAGTFYRASIGT